MKNKTVAFFVLTVSLLLGISSSCAHWEKNKNLAIYINLERKNFSQSSVLVFNFQEPSYAEGMGVEVAGLFHLTLLESKAFKIAGLVTRSTWNRIADTEETRIADAIEEGKSKNYDYILVGELVDFFYGGLNPTRVKLKVRLIEVNTRITVFLAEYSKQSNAADTSFPMNTQLSNKAEHPKQLTIEMAKALVKSLVKKL
jgi:hypothetical protein